MNPAPVAAGEVTLRPWRAGEAELYIRLRDELVFRFTTEPPDLDRVRCRSNILAALPDPHVAPFAICAPGGDPVGNMAVSRRGKKAEISYWLAAEGRGRGWAKAALLAATAWAFSTWPLEAIELEIAVDNQASMGVAVAAGYRPAGLRLESACGGPARLMRLTAAEAGAVSHRGGGGAPTIM